MKYTNSRVAPPTGGLVDIALQHVEDGWAVFPLIGKKPLTTHGVKDASRDPDEVRSMFSRFEGTATGIGGACDGKVVVDIDPRSGGRFPEDLPPTRVHYSGRGDGGCHLIFSLPNDVEGLKSSTSAIAKGLDVKTGAGSYVVLPGSTHPETGDPYTMNSVPVSVIPVDLLSKLKDQAKTTTSGQSLATLLANPPEVGGRNEWLTRVAGHYARQYRHEEENYHQSLYAANRLLRNNLDVDEVAKIGTSIWAAEMEKLQDPDLEHLLDESNGWLASGGDCIRTLIIEGKGKGAIQIAYELALFDLRVRGRLWNPETDSWIYECDLVTRRKPGEVERIFVSSDDLGNPRTARQFLAKRALSVGSNVHLVHNAYDWCSRLLMYLDSQPAPERTLSKRLGWEPEENGYITNTGTIDAEGQRESTVMVPHPELEWVGDQYGLRATPEIAQEVLAEVMHFQETETACLFGSWWAATLVKQWVQPRVSQFPVCAVEAASGSGKTTGFFSFMVQLSGSTSGEGHYTPAVLRNRLAANLNGVTWVDDMENPEAIHEIIRVLTAGGSLSKMDGNFKPRQFELVGSLMISGEALGFENQRALRDRVVSLSPPPPQGRVSRRDPERSQWLDVVELRERLLSFGGGHEIAGQYLKMCSTMASQVTEWFTLERNSRDGGGRLRDRDLILLVGARVLDVLMGGRKVNGKTAHEVVSEVVTRSDNLEMEQRLEASSGGEAIDGDNTLTTRLIPAYLMEGNVFMGSSTAVRDSTDDQEIWISYMRLGNWWSDKNHGRINLRTESTSSILSQLRQLRVLYPEYVFQRRKRIDGGRNTSPKNVWVLSGPVYESIVKRLDYF